MGMTMNGDAAGVRTVFLPHIEDTAAPTVAEVNAGLDLSDYIDHARFTRHALPDTIKPVDLTAAATAYEAELEYTFDAAEVSPWERLFEATAMYVYDSTGERVGIVEPGDRTDEFHLWALPKTWQSMGGDQA